MQQCHPERSEGSLILEILRCAQNDLRLEWQRNVFLGKHSASGWQAVPSPAAGPHPSLVWGGQSGGGRERNPGTCARRACSAGGKERESGRKAAAKNGAMGTSRGA